MSEDEGEKEHEPSQKKLDAARERGEIPRSADLGTAAAYGGLLLAAATVGPAALDRAGEAAAVLLGQADRLGPVLLGGGTAAIGGVLAQFGLALAPFFVFPAVAALLVTLAQRALVFTPDKLAPKLSRISPLSNAKNKFGRKGLFEFAKSFVKLAVVALLLGVFLVRHGDEMMMTIYLSPAMSIAVLLREVTGFLLLTLLIAGLIGGGDYLWQRAEHIRTNRMTRKEMLDEHKEAEGDPHMKSKRRQKGYDIATNRMLADVPTADVVIVNPTHYAVALKWSRTSGRAPVCVAKGVDEVAARIREAAAIAGVPLHRDPPTARALHATLRVGDEVGQDQYRAVAAAIRFAEAMRAKARLRGGGVKR